MSAFKIGTTKLDGGRKGSGKTFFKLEDGNNLFRILPPMWSLADSDRYYKYWRIHWGFSTSDGHQTPVVCTERKDKNKVVVERCAICDMVEEAKRELNYLKENGASPEQLKTFEDSRINPYEGRGAYYVYAVNSAGEIGILQMKKTMKEAYEAKYRELSDEGIQADGVNGVYMNFKRTGQGRYNTKYTVEVAMEADPTNPRSKRYKEHVLTEDLINKIENTTQDLTKLYNYIPREEMEALAASSDGDDRKFLVDRIFSKGQKTEPVIQSSVPGTNARFVTKVEVNPDTLTLSARTPETPQVGSVSSKPVTEKAAAPTAAPAPAANGLSGLSDEEFMRVFQERYGNK
jgi:hypothetical protein